MIKTGSHASLEAICSFKNTEGGKNFVVVGSHGTIIYIEGYKIRKIPSGTDSDFNAICVLKTGNIIIVGDNAIIVCWDLKKKPYIISTYLTSFLVSVCPLGTGFVAVSDDGF